MGKQVSELNQSNIVILKGICVSIGELELYVGNGVFLHVHVGSFDKIFGIGIGCRGLGFYVDPIIIIDCLHK